MADDPYIPPEVPQYEQETEIVRRRRVEPAPVVQETYEPVVERRYVPRDYVLVRWARIIYFIFGVIEALIAIRFLLRLLGANRDNQFASFIYNVTHPFVGPFMGLFNEPGMGRSVLELSSLVALLVYALLAYALVKLLYLFA